MSTNVMRFRGWQRAAYGGLWLCRCVALVILVAAVSPGAFAAEPQGAGDAKSFIDGLGAEVLNIIKAPNVSEQDRKQKFRQLFNEHFDVPTIGRFVIGRYWNRASTDEQNQYLDVFRNYVAAIYAAQFANYQGERFQTTGARPVGEGESLVKSEIERDSGPPIAVEFRVKGTSGSWKIVDVTVEGVSLVVTKRDEFSSVLAQEGIKGVVARMQTALKNA